MDDHDHQLKVRGIRSGACDMHVPLLLIGFICRKHLIESKHTVKQRYFWFATAASKKDWRADLILEVRYWKGDNARPIKYNLKAPKRIGHYTNFPNLFITEDQAEMLDRINLEILSCHNQ